MRGQYGTLYRGMAGIGYPPPLVDDMELWQVADALGVGDDDRDPAPIGSRGIVLKSDTDEGGPGGSPGGRASSTTLERAKADPSLSGSSISGEDW